MTDTLTIPSAFTVMHDPEVSFTPDGKAIGRLRLSAKIYTLEDGFLIDEPDERGYLGKYNNIQGTVWGPMAEELENLIKKGDIVFVDGFLKEETYESKTTQEMRSSLKLTIKSFAVMPTVVIPDDRQQNTRGQTRGNTRPTNKAVANAKRAMDIMDDEGDDDVPF